MNYGTPAGTPQQPTPYGTPASVVPDSQAITLRTVALGFSSGQEPPQLPGGASSRGSNFFTADGGLSPRPGLRYFPVSSGSNTSALMTLNPGWVGEIEGIGGGRFPVVLSAQDPLVYSGTSWSRISQLQGSGATPIGYSRNTLLVASAAFFDAVSYYHPVSDSFELAFVQRASTLPYTFRPNELPPVFSTLTNAPGASYVAPFDNRLVFASITAIPSSSTTIAPATNVGYPQRVWWSARGDPETYVGPDGGFEELLDAKGFITRLMAEGGDRLIVFFENEIWQGLKVAFPFNFQFIPLTKNVGTFNPWSVAETPWGLMFLGDDLNIHVLPKGGSPQPVGGDIWRFLRDTVFTGAGARDIANGVYHTGTGKYLLTYRSKQGTEVGVAVSLANGQATWNPIGFDRPANWQIKRMGTTSVQSLQASTAAGVERVLIVDGTSQSTTMGGFGNVLEFTSEATNDLGTAIDCRYFTTIPNPDPTQKLHVREIRLDYRQEIDQSSVLSLRLSPDFGTTYPVDSLMSMPLARFSAQSRIGVSLPAIYPGVELRHASGQTFTIQGLSAVVESLGNG